MSAASSRPREARRWARRSGGAVISTTAARTRPASIAGMVRETLAITQRPAASSASIEAAKP